MKQLKNYFSNNNIPGNIKFWILFAFIIRLYGITNPPLEVSHNWRQTTVTMVARNFLEVDNNIFLPRIDIAGEKTGITGMEFPIFNYLIYLASLLFGYNHWYGRLINLVFSSIGTFYFYKLVKNHFKKKVAFHATIFLLFSIWFTFSRKIMPDTFSCSLLIKGIYFGDKFIYNRSGNYIRNLTLYSFLTTLGILSKLPSAYFLIIFTPIIFQRDIIRNKKVIFIAVSILALIPSIIWYFYWTPYLVKKYEFWHFFMGLRFGDGIKQLIKHWSDLLANFYDKPLKFSGFAIFLFGLFQIYKTRNRKMFWTFTLLSSAFLVLILKSGETFTKHDYYIVPYVPIMALVAGYGISSITNKKMAIGLLILFSLEGIANQQHDFQNNKNQDLLMLEADLDSVSDRNDLVIINSRHYPTPMYFAHRKGWVSITDYSDANIISLKEKGLKYIIILKQGFGLDIDLSYPIVIENDYYKVYRP